MDKEIMDVVFLLDRSGSMHGMEEDTIGGFNSYLEGMRGQNARITTVLFDDKYEMITKKEDIKTVKNLTKDTYYTRGSTALLDAIGKTIKFMDKNKSNKVIFIITTDGLENSSKDYNKMQIKELIEGHSSWEFIYLGANIDSYHEASCIGIRADRISNYHKTKKGTSNLFKKLKDVCMCYDEEDCISSNWNEGLENDI